MFLFNAVGADSILVLLDHGAAVFQYYPPIWCNSMIIL